MFMTIMAKISTYAIPAMIVLIPSYAFFVKKIKVYEVFCDGAKDGFETAVKIIPFLVGMLVAIGILRKSGAIDLMIQFFAPFLAPLGMPAEILPLAVLKPLSGGGASGVLTDLFATYGPDSYIGRMASIMQGSTETTLYVLAVYFGAVGIRKSRHAVATGLVADLAGVTAAVIITNIMFGAK